MRTALTLHARECRVVSDRACLALQNPFIELKHHKDVVRYFVLAAEAKARRWRETEARVVLGMAEYNDRAES